MMTKMISEQTDKDNDVNGTVVQDNGASSGRVTTRQYVPGRHRETGCGNISLDKKFLLLSFLDLTSFALDLSIYKPEKMK